MLYFPCESVFSSAFPTVRLSVRAGSVADRVKCDEQAGMAWLDSCSLGGLGGFAGAVGRAVCCGTEPSQAPQLFSVKSTIIGYSW